jgi:hypothetical protein
MKLKGISPLEQNVDRMVLGFVGLALVGAVGLQFLPEKTVKIGTSPKQVKPTQAMSIVEEEAALVAAKLDSPSLTQPQVSPFSLDRKFALGAAAGTLTPRTARAPLGKAPALGQGIMHARQENDTFALPAVPAPTGAATSVVQVTISPVEKLNNLELAKLLPAAQPFDKSSVSVEFGWSGAQLREHLQSDPDGEGPATQLPVNWWRDQAGGRSVDMVDIVGVQYERQTILKADGTAPATPETVILAAPPGRASKLEEWKANVKGIGDVMQVMLPAVQELADEIQRPPFYQIVAGPEWTPPSKTANPGAAAGKVVEINSNRNRLADVDRRIADLDKKLQEAGGPGGGDRERDRGAPPPAPRQGPGKGGSQGQAPPPPEQRQQKGDPRVIEQQLKRAQAEREAILARLAALGEPVAGADANQETPVALPTLDNPDVRVWTHDMTAEPGATYQYRARVVINNPLYGRNLQAAQTNLAASSLIEGPWSEWTPEVHVPRSSYFFITSASESNEISPQPSAGAEMYVFKYGYYRKETLQLNPGDSLFGEARMPKTLKYADMDKLKALLGDPAGLPPTGDAPPVPQPVPAGKGGARQGDPGPAPAAPGQPLGPLDAIWTVAVPERERIVMDVTFLDASQLPAGDQNALVGEQAKLQAVFRDEAGRIVVMSPDSARNNELYERVSKSAKAGETQGVVVAKPPEPERPRQPIDRPDREPRRSAPPGGGGGG